MALTPSQMDGITNARFPAGETNPAMTMGRLRRAVAWVDDAATAGTAVGEKLLVYADATYCPNGLLVKQVNWLPGVNVAGDDTDYATIIVNSRSANGSTAVSISTVTTKTTGGSGSLTAFVRYSAAITGANAYVGPGLSISVAATKAASGKALTAAAASAGDKFGIEVVYEIL